MIHLFYGTDRVKTRQAIDRLLGEGYEVIDGSELKPTDLPNIFLGTSLFGETRKILLKDLSENKTLFEKLPDFLNSPHEIVLWEKTFDRRLKVNKDLASDRRLDLREFKVYERVDRNLAFNVYDVALTNGPRALKMLEPLKATEDPYRLLGAWSWKAIDNFKNRPGDKEKRVLKELSNLDMKLKTTRLSSEPWLLLQSFLLRLSSL